LVQHFKEKAYLSFLKVPNGKKGGLTNNLQAGGSWRNHSGKIPKKREETRIYLTEYYYSKEFGGGSIEVGEELTSFTRV